jgi:hypothetical protein
MSHLNPERLAALADDDATAAEAAHLAACAACRRERDAYRALLRLAARERDAAPPAPLTRWESLAPALRGEGLLRERAGEGSKTRGARHGINATSRLWLQAAAAVVLVAGGTALGRWTAPARRGGDASAARGTIARAGSGEGSARLTASTAADTILRFASLAEAQAVLTQAERRYQQALMYLATNDTTSRTVTNSEVYRARLATFDAIAGAAQQGVDELPHDPLLNQAYLSAVAVREATLRQLGQSLASTGSRVTLRPF